MSSVYKIDGVQIKSPPIQGDFEQYNVTYSGRTADGKMKLELIDQKRKLILRYPVISEEDYELIRSLAGSTKLFFEVEFPNGPNQEVMVAYSGAFKKIPARNDSGIWYWKDFELSLIEQ